MKKYLLASLAVFMMILTTVVFTSCSEEDEYTPQLQYMLTYELGKDGITYDPLQYEGRIPNDWCDCFDAELKNVSGGSYSNSTFTCNTADPSQYEAAIAAACEAATAKADKLDTSIFSGSFTISVRRLYTDKTKGYSDNEVFSVSYQGTAE